MIIPANPIPTDFSKTSGKCLAAIWKPIGSITLGDDGSVTVTVGGYADQASAFDDSSPLIATTIIIPPGTLAGIPSVIASIEAAVVKQQGLLQGAIVQVNPT